MGTGISEASKRVPIFLHDVSQRRQGSEFLFWTGTQTNIGELEPSLVVWQISDPTATIIACSAFES